MSYFIKRLPDHVVYRSWDHRSGPNGRLRIAVLKLDHVGDLWMSIGPLRELRRRFASAHITLVVGSWNIETARRFELADDYAVFDFFPRNPKLGRERRPPEEVRSILPGMFDLAIDMHVGDETRPVLVEVPARLRAGFADRRHGSQLDIALPPAAFRVRRGGLYKLVQKAGLTGRVPRRLLDRNADQQQAHLQHTAELLSFLVTKTADQLGNDARRGDTAASGAGPIVVAPFSNSELREWPVAYFGALVAGLVQRGEVLLVGRADNRDGLEAIAELAREKIGASAAVGLVIDPTEQAFNDLLGSASLVVSNNSGAGHVAAQLGRPTLGIFTASHLPELWGFQGPLVSMLMSTIDCRGCGIDVVRRCPIAIRCKWDVTPEHVLAEVDALASA